MASARQSQSIKSKKKGLKTFLRTILKDISTYCIMLTPKRLPFSFSRDKNQATT
jgi:hypothetical protein